MSTYKVGSAWVSLSDVLVIDERVPVNTYKSLELKGSVLMKGINAPVDITILTLSGRDMWEAEIARAEKEWSGLLNAWIRFRANGAP